MNKTKLVAVLDTNVIYPLAIRDFLLWLASEDLFIPKWSKHIFDEWETVLKRKKFSNNEIKRILQRAILAFPNAEIKGYESLIERFTLPDEKDCHVLAAAYYIGADLIVTNNIKDFPKEYLASFGIERQTADDFIKRLIVSNQTDSLVAFNKMVKQKQNPRVSNIEVLERLEKVGLTKTVKHLKTIL